MNKRQILGSLKSTRGLLSALITDIEDGVDVTMDIANILAQIGKGVMDAIIDLTKN